MASASSSHYFTFACVLLCMCIHLSTSEQDDPRSDPPTSGLGTRGSSPTPPEAPVLGPSPSRSPLPSRSLSPAPAPTSFVPIPGNPSKAPESSKQNPKSAKRKQARILGLALASFAGVLQAVVVLFLFVKRRQMLKHVYGSRDHQDRPPHVWANAYKKPDRDFHQVQCGITGSSKSMHAEAIRVLVAINEDMCDVAKMDMRLDFLFAQTNEGCMYIKQNATKEHQTKLHVVVLPGVLCFEFWHRWLDNHAWNLLAYGVDMLLHLLHHIEGA